MKIGRCHAWPSTYRKALKIQEGLRKRIVKTGGVRGVRMVAGADVSYSMETDRVCAGVVLMSYPEMETVETVTVCGKSRFPYVPGMLTFREGPVLMRAFRELKGRPDVVIFDGQGFAHPRRMGLASHMGIVLGIPSVGCAKSRLTGEYAEPGQEMGDWTPLRDEGEIIGRVVRTRAGVKPVFVSVGHMVGLAAATRLVMGCLRGVRLPEPTRRAHHLVTMCRKEEND